MVWEQHHYLLLRYGARNAHPHLYSKILGKGFCVCVWERTILATFTGLDCILLWRVCPSHAYLQSSCPQWLYCTVIVLMITLMYYIYNWVLVITYPLLRLWQLVINGTKSTFYTCLALLASGEAFKELEPVMITSKDQESHSLMTVGAVNVRGFMCLGCKMWKAGFKPYSLSLENGSYFCWTAAGWGRRVFSATGWRPWTSFLL